MKKEMYDELIEAVRPCKRCVSVDTSMCLLSRLNGPLNADIMFVGMAPGKKTPGATEKPFFIGPSSENY